MTSGIALTIRARSNARKRVQKDSRPIRRPWHGLDIIAYLLLAVLMAPPLAETFDLTLLTAAPSRWLQWHQGLFSNWKFGAPYAILNAATFALHFYLAALGLTPVVAQHIATKLPLIAGALLDGVLLGHLAPSHLARRMRAAWLLSPVVLWVAAGQPQVEPLSAAGLLLALLLARRRRFGLAAFVAIIGASFEYYPLAYFVVPLLFSASLTGRVRWEAIWRTGAGAAIGLLVGFPQVLFSSVGRQSVVAGLVSTQTAGPSAAVKSRSVWFVVNRLSGFAGTPWVELFVLAAGTIVLITLVRQGHTFSYNLGVSCTATIVLLSVILDPESLPQFSAITALGLLLLVITTGIPLSLAVLLPLPGLLSWFVHDPWTQFTSDVNPTGLAHIWTGFPTSHSAYVALGAMYALGVLGVATLAMASAWWRPRGSPGPYATSLPPSHRSGLAGIFVGGIVAAYLSGLALQATVVTGLTGSKPATLFDAPQLLYMESLPSRVVRSRESVAVSLGSRGEAMMQAAKRAGSAQRQGWEVLLMAPKAVFTESKVGAATQTFSVPSEPLRRALRAKGVRISGWLVTLLVHHRGIRASLTDFSLQIGPSYLRPVSASPVLPHWEFATFVVPTQELVTGNGLEVVGSAGPDRHTYANGPDSGRAYLRILPAIEEVNLTVGARTVPSPVIATPAGLAIESRAFAFRRAGVSPATCQLIDCAGLQLAIRWPAYPWHPDLMNWLLVLLASVGVLSTSAFAVVTLILIRR